MKKKRSAANVTHSEEKEKTDENIDTESTFGESSNTHTHAYTLTP